MLPYTLHPAQPPSAGPHIPRVLYQHIPVRSSTSLGSSSTYHSYIQRLFLPPFPTPPHLDSRVAAGMYLQRVASGIRKDTVSQGAEGGRLAQDLGLSCTEYFSRERTVGACIRQKFLDVCAVCSWNDNQIGRVQVSSANS